MKVITRGVPPSPLKLATCSFCKSVFEFHACEAERSEHGVPLGKALLRIKCPVCATICVRIEQ